MPVIGVGGVCTPEDIIEYIMAGASVVQACIAAIVEGLQIFRRLAKGVAEWLKEHGNTSVEDIRGIALKYLTEEPD